MVRFLLASIVCSVSMLAPAFGQRIIFTVAGVDWVFTDKGKPATQAKIAAPGRMAVDAQGNIYFPDADNALIFKVDRSGILTVVAGNGIAGYSGDNGPATSASLNDPLGVAVDPAGNLYIADNNNNRIRKVTNGVITTFAGNGFKSDESSSGTLEGIPATAAAISPLVLFADRTGSIYESDARVNQVRKIGSDGRISTVAGNGKNGYDGDNKPAISSSLQFPRDIAVDVQGNLFIADMFNHRIRQVDSGGTITTVAGTGNEGRSPDGTRAKDAAINAPAGVAIDAAGNLYFSDSVNEVVQVISASTGTISTIAGTGTAGFSGDGGPAKAAQLSAPGSMAFDGDGNLLVCDSDNRRIRRIRGPAIDTMAGNGLFRAFDEGIPATQAFLFQPQGMAFDSQGNLYVADTNNQKVRKITPDGKISTVAGNGAFDYSGDGGSAVLAALAFPRDVAVDSSGDLYIADAHSRRIRKVSNGIIQSIACGDIPTPCGAAEHGDLLVEPSGVAVAPDGTVYVADGAGNAVRAIRKDGSVGRFAGDSLGKADCSGDGGPAAQACVSNPRGVAIDSSGAVYIADTNHNSIRVVRQGIIRTFAGNGQAGYAGDGAPALLASLNAPQKIAVDADGTLYIADTGNHVVRVVAPDGMISTLAGIGSPGFSGDGSIAINARMNSPAGVGSDAAGNVYIADTLNDRVRAVPKAAPQVGTQGAGGVFQFTGSAGGPPAPAQTLNVSISSNRLAVTLPFVAVPLVFPGDTNWLRVSPPNGVTPAPVQISADPGNLAPGTYFGAVLIWGQTLLEQGPDIRFVQFTVTAPLPRNIQLDPPAITLSLTQQFPSAVARVAVRNTGGGGDLSISVTPPSETWVNATVSNAVVHPGSPGQIEISADASKQNPGSYKSVVSVRSSDGRTIPLPVTIVLLSSRPVLALSRAAVAFRAVEGGGTALPAQSLFALNRGGATLKPSPTLSDASGGPAPQWLSLQVTPNAAAGGGARLDLVANPVGLAAGIYQALLQVTAEGAGNPVQQATILLEVMRAGSDPGPAVTPSTLLFTTQRGGGNAGSQLISAYNLGADAVDFTVFGGTLDGTNWLTYRVPKPPLAPGQPLQVTVQTDAAGLTDGVYRAVLTFLFLDSSRNTTTIRNVAITLFVGSPSTSPRPAALAGSRLAAGSCTPDQTVQPVITVLGTGTRVPAGVPAVIDALVTDRSGCPLTTGSVTAGFTDASAGVSAALTSLGDGTWEGIWMPPNPGTSKATVTAADTDLKVSGSSDSVSIDIDPPLDGVLSTASVASRASVRGGSVAPGSLISIFGSNLGPRQSTSRQLPWDTQLSGVSVRLGGVLLPISYVSENQVDAMVPFATQPGVVPQLVVAYKSSISLLPLPVALTDAQPAVFTQDSSGTGLGSISNANGLISSANPAHAGDAITIRCSGLGAVNPTWDTGVAVPDSGSYQVTQTVTVTIGTAHADFVSAALAPGRAGEYNVVVRVPSLSAGTYDLTVTVGTSSSPPVQIIVQ
jgi:uncharacterized protein (TIGR03437 family)